jgi:hypothetical protein
MRLAYNVRPLSFAEILDRAFRVFRDHFSVLVGISAVLWLPYGAILAVGSTSRVVSGIAQIAFFLLLPVTSVAVTAAVANVYLDRPITVGDAYRSIRAILMPIVGTYLLLYLLAVLGFIALVIPGVFVAYYSSVYLLVALGLIGVIPGIYLLNCWSLTAPVMIVEHRFGMTALRRSRQLVTGVWWRTFGIFFVAFLIVQVPAGVLQLLWSHIPVLGPILTAATSAVASSYSLVVLVIYYFDRRCRTEDFDLRFLAEQIRSDTAAVSPAIGEPSSIA